MWVIQINLMIINFLTNFMYESFESKWNILSCFCRCLNIQTSHLLCKLYGFILWYFPCPWINLIANYDDFCIRILSHFMKPIYEVMKTLFFCYIINQQTCNWTNFIQYIPSVICSCDRSKWFLTCLNTLYEFTVSQTLTLTTLLLCIMSFYPNSTPTVASILLLN